MATNWRDDQEYPDPIPNPLKPEMIHPLRDALNGLITGFDRDLLFTRLPAFKKAFHEIQDQLDILYLIADYDPPDRM